MGSPFSTQEAEVLRCAVVTCQCQLKSFSYLNSELSIFHPFFFLSAVESYAQHLISEKKRALVAAYCAHLTAPRRVALYSRLLLSMINDLPRVTSGGNVNPQIVAYNASEFDYRSGK